MTLPGPGDFSPPDDPPLTVYRCEDCGEIFTEDDQTASGECPHCDSGNICVHEECPDPEYPDDDDDPRADFLYDPPSLNRSCD